MLRYERPRHCARVAWRLGPVIASALIVLGQAGTANEAGAAAGLPVIAFERDPTAKMVGIVNANGDCWAKRSQYFRRSRLKPQEESERS